MLICIFTIHHHITQIAYIKGKGFPQLEPSYKSFDRMVMDLEALSSASMERDLTLEDVRDWNPQPDPTKPPLPYRTGLILSIRPHIPPGPFGHNYRKECYPRSRGQWKHLFMTPPSVWCLNHPPVETPPPEDRMQRELQIIDGLASGDGRGAQLVRCHVEGMGDKVFVAKIYDTFYYPYRDSFFGHPEDPTYVAELDYSLEANAYQTLIESGVNGEFAPEYHGSWTFDLPVPSAPGATRPVRMVLLSWVPCTSLFRLYHSDNFKKISGRQKLSIVARAMEAETKIFFHGVGQGDFAPRNTLLVNSDWEAQPPKVMLVDFGKATIFRHPNFKYRMMSRQRPLSPRYRFWGSVPTEWDSWVPQPHRSRNEAFRGWLATEWAEDGEFEGPGEEMREDRNFEEPVEIVEPED